MATNHDYLCNGCKKATPRDELFVKKIRFDSMGRGASTLRGRVIAWLCEPCMTADPDWQRPANMLPAERVERSISNG